MSPFPLCACQLLSQGAVRALHIRQSTLSSSLVQRVAPAVQGGGKVLSHLPSNKGEEFQSFCSYARLWCDWGSVQEAAGLLTGPVGSLTAMQCLCWLDLCHHPAGVGNPVAC